MIPPEVPPRAVTGHATLNGVDTSVLAATLDAVNEAPEAARYRFRATNAWVSGSHSRSTMHSYRAGDVEHEHVQPYTAEVDQPPEFAGRDLGPTAVEWLLHALAGCLTACVAQIAAARGVTLSAISATAEGDIDLSGALGLNDQVRNGVNEIRVTFDVRGDAPPATIRAIVDEARARSAVFDALTNGLPVRVATTSP